MLPGNKKFAHVHVVWNMGLGLLKKFVGVDAGNVVAKFMESKLAYKHNLETYVKNQNLPTTRAS